MKTMTTQSDRALIAQGLRIASDLPVGEEPTDTARAVIVELSKRLHLKLTEAAMRQDRESSAPPTRDSFVYVALGVFIGVLVGIAASALLQIA
jgi:hypothetical protein